MRRFRAVLIPGLLLCLAVGVRADPGQAALRLFHDHCAQCHGPDRLGGMGPALLPENLTRLKRDRAAGVIRDGRPATQMPAFGSRLSAGQIQSLVDLIYTPPARKPTWGQAQMLATHKVFIKPDALPDHPLHHADPMNMFVVVELGDHHASILDGDNFSVLKRVPTHRALHGGPKYSPDGRFVYFASRDGWISKFDMWSLRYVAEIRAGINTRNLALSGDGRFVMVANYLPHTLVVLDARDLSPLRTIPVRDDDGRESRVSAVYTAAPRGSFVAALKDIPEVWEIGYRQATADGRDFPIRRLHLADYLDDFFFDQSYRLLIGTARDNRKGQVIDLDRGRQVATLDIDGMPHLGSGITWQYRGHTVLAAPNLGKGEISIIDMQTWKTLKRIKTDGPGFFIRSHEHTPYAWADVFFGPHRDEVHIIDKRTLKIVRTLRPVPGKTAAHVEFDKDGRHALLSIWDMRGAVIVYDAATFREVKRLPMVKPSGKYNVHNKITRSAGTSH
jgi:hypothetical protein